ncbi:MAG TPA: hypothetical protein VHT96_12825 [Clostridia bacterium]|nr:hypothetical protein [Clostridia bacterium]
MNRRLLYKKAYRILKDSTPLKFDCGLLCGAKCCSGESDAGMCLFPGEEILLEKHGGFLSIRNEKMADTDVLFAVCSRTCDRRYRPLACRIFPYAPYLDGDGRLSVIEDPRARYLCPLLNKLPEIRMDRLFRRNVRSVFQLLIQDDEIKDFVHLLSDVLDEYKRFVG